MAAGIYYTQADYEARWGADELVRLTDADGDGIADPDTFARAVADASADVDAYLGVKYQLPLAAPLPRVVKSIAAALVREKLHGTYPTETVTQEADRARRQLRDLSTGTAKLTVDDTGAEADTGSPGVSGIRIASAARVFGADQLARY